MTKFTPVIERFSTIAGFLPENIMTPCHHHRWYLYQIFGYFRLFYDSGKHRANYFFLFIISWEGKSPLLNVKNVDPSAGVVSTAPGRWLANTLYRTFTRFIALQKRDYSDSLRFFELPVPHSTMYMSSNKPRHEEDSNIYDHLWIVE